MSRILALSVAPGEVRGVLLEDGRPVELVLERDATSSLVGAAFFGRIARVLPSLPGAFVEIGLARPAFLPGERLPGGGALVEGAGLLVKIVKDPFADKAAEITAAPDFQGRFAVWTPSRPGIAVSRQIAPAERARLSELLAPLVRPGEGVVLRSHAAGVTGAEIAAELDRLRRDHAGLVQAAAAAKTPCRLDPVEDAIGRILANLDPRLDRVLTDDRASLVRLRQGAADPARIDFEAEPGFAERHGLTEAFEQALAPRIVLDEGGEIIIESTAAFTAIDVNAAAAAGARRRAAAAILSVNLAAAKAIARQVRLRNIGGAVVIDFITMSSREQRLAVEVAFTEAAAGDPIPIELHGWTRLGHLELTRKRGAASIADRLLVAGGTRRAKSPTTIGLEILRALVSTALPPGPVEIRLHRSVAAELGGPLSDAFQAACTRAGRRVRLAIDAAADVEAFDIGRS